MKKTTFLCLLLALAGGHRATARALAEKPFEPDLAAFVNGKGGTVVNRTVSAIQDGTRKGIRFNEKPGDGAAWFDGIDFANGVIEFDVRGKNVLQQSFVGVAFHGIPGTASDVVYFRPFNFRSEDPVRRAHGVQYTSEPDYTWDKLRAEHPGVYEKAVTPPPDPDGWFHARIVVASSKVSVFVNGSREPSLVVEKLNQRKQGAIGLWVGNNSGGDFANLQVTKAQ
jgi:hypothetical protein